MSDEMLFQVLRDVSDANPSWLHHVKMLVNNVTGNLWSAFHSKELKQKDVKAISKLELSDYEGDYERQKLQVLVTWPVLPDVLSSEQQLNFPYISL